MLLRHSATLRLRTTQICESCSLGKFGQGRYQVSTAVINAASLLAGPTGLLKVCGTCPFASVIIPEKRWMVCFRVISR